MALDRLRLVHPNLFPLLSSCFYITDILHILLSLLMIINKTNVGSSNLNMEFVKMVANVNKHRNKLIINNVE